MTRNDVPLVLLHGFLGCKDDWHKIASQLQTGRRIAVFDLPGHGLAADAREDMDCSLEATAHRIEAVLEALETPHAHVIGYSLGGRAALYFAATRPGAVASLILEGASPGIEDETARAARRDEDEARAAALERHGLAAFVDEWEKLALFDTQKKLEAKVLAEQRERRLRGDAAALARSLRHAGTGTQPWLGDRLAAVTAPTLLVTGGLDEKFTAIARDMETRMPSAMHVSVDGAGHNVHLERPGDFLALVDHFLGRVVRGELH